MQGNVEKPETAETFVIPLWIFAAHSCVGPNHELLIADYQSQNCLTKSLAGFQMAY
jgi:hypothetical protein